MAKALTIKAVEAIRPRASRMEVPDGLLPGLYFVVQPTGSRSWAVRYRFAGRPRKHTLGSYPAIDLSDARELGRNALRAVAEGRDPGDEKKAARSTEASRPRNLFEAVAESFVHRYAKANTRESTWRETERILDKDVLPHWRGRDVREIGRRNVIELLDHVIDRGAPIHANRVLAVVRRLFGWAVERGIVETSPCQHVRAPTAERSRDRILSDDELRIVWRVATEDGWPFGRLVQLLILTGQRRDEVAEMRWLELDLGARLWTLPRERSKNDTAHEVPLSDQALAIIERLPRIAGKAKLVFTTTGETPMSGFSRGKERLDKLVLADLQEAARRSGGDPDKVEPPDRWTLHDLRRTMASGMARLGIQLPIIEKVLNHSSGSFAGIVGVYQRHSFSDEKRAALERWARFVIELSVPATATRLSG